MFLYWFEGGDQSRRSRAIALLACSPMMALGAMVLANGTRGITEASAMRSRSMPQTLRRLSTTDMSSCPILAVQLWCQMVVTPSRIKSSIAAGASAVGMTSRFTKRPRIADLPRELHGSPQCGQIGWIGEDLRIDLDRIFGLGTCQELAGGHAVYVSKPEAIGALIEQAATAR